MLRREPLLVLPDSRRQSASGRFDFGERFFLGYSQPDGQRRGKVTAQRGGIFRRREGLAVEPHDTKGFARVRFGRNGIAETNFLFP